MKNITVKEMLNILSAMPPDSEIHTGATSGPLFEGPIQSKHIGKKIVDGKEVIMIELEGDFNA